MVWNKQIWRLLATNNGGAVNIPKHNRGALINICSQGIHLDAPSVIGTDPEKNSSQYQVGKTFNDYDR